MLGAECFYELRSGCKASKVLEKAGDAMHNTMTPFVSVAFQPDGGYETKYFGNQTRILTWWGPECGILLHIQQHKAEGKAEFAPIPMKARRELSINYLGSFFESEDGETKRDKIQSAIEDIIFDCLAEGAQEQIKWERRDGG